MTRFADPRVEWRMEDVERSLQRKAESYEVTALASDVARLECSLRESCAEIYGLRTQLEATQDQIARIFALAEEQS